MSDKAQRTNKMWLWFVRAALAVCTVCFGSGMLVAIYLSEVRMGFICFLGAFAGVVGMTLTCEMLISAERGPRPREFEDDGIHQ